MKESCSTRQTRSHQPHSPPASEPSTRCRLAMASLILNPGGRAHLPKSRSRSGSPEPFRSSVVPPYVRRCASLDTAIPWASATSSSSRFWNWCGSRLFCPTSAAGVPARGVDCGLHLCRLCGWIADTRYEVPVPELGTPGSVGAAGGRPPAATRPIAPRWTTLALDSAHLYASAHAHHQVKLRCRLSGKTVCAPSRK